MATCGMYDYSGEWLYRTGLPAKSGVGGGILAVQPGRIGIGVFSPRLDAQGNSVRGIAVCRELAADLGLHLFDAVAARGAGGAPGDDAARRGVEAAAVAARRRAPAQRGTPAAPLPPAGRARVRVGRAGRPRAHGAVGGRRLLHRQPQGRSRGSTAPPRACSPTPGRRCSRLGKTLDFAEAGACWQPLIDAGVDREAFYADDDFALEHGEDLLLARDWPDRTAEARVCTRRLRAVRGPGPRRPRAPGAAARPPERITRGRRSSRPASRPTSSSSSPRAR